MDQQNPTNTDWGTGSTGSMGGATGTPGSTSGGFGTGTGGTSPGGYGVSSATDTGHCPTCGQSTRGGAGLEQFLGRLGITEDMINNLKNQFSNVDIDEYMNTARDYLKDGSTKATTYAKENPGKVAAGVATLALGAGLLYAALNRDKS
jgi:hypothetical protein